MTENATKKAEALDAADPFRDFQSHFDLPDGVIYLDGNSLGPPPKAALQRLRATAEKEWGEGLIRSWNDASWIDLPQRCGAKIAPLIGAAREDVIVCDSVSVNIFKLAAALLEKNEGALAYEEGEFPTDGYILQGLSRFNGAGLKKLPPDDPSSLNGASISVLIKSAVHYKTASVVDIAAWEKAARAAGVSIVWDLSHAAGAVALNLQNDGARFAVGCGYKFLNGGPGAPAFIYVARSEADRLNQPLAGWMGHASPFDFADAYAPGAGVTRFACGTPPILSMSALDAALDMFDGIDMQKLEAKTKSLGDIFLDAISGLGLETVAPKPGERRGGHVCVRHEHGYEIMQALIARNVIGDYRAPDLMRFGFSPLILSHGQVCDAAKIFAEILETEEWKKPEYAVRRKVT